MYEFQVTLSLPVEAQNVTDAIEEFRNDARYGTDYVYTVDTGEALLTYDMETGESVEQVRLTKEAVDAVMAEIDAAYTDLRSERYPYPSQYQRVEDARLALYKLLGFV